MVFVSPRLSDRNAYKIIVLVYQRARFKRRVFLRIMQYLIQNNLFRLSAPSARINGTNSFNSELDDAMAFERYRFTISQLRELSLKLKFSPSIITSSGDVVCDVEALAIVCRRLSEPSKLFTVADEFGRSVGAYSRIFLHTVNYLYDTHTDLLYFNRRLLRERVFAYCASISSCGSPLATCWGFIDGTKHYIARPSSRSNPPARKISSGPYGIVISLFGPAEGRRHDATMLSISNLLEEHLHGKYLYGDPAYGCGSHLICPFPNAPPNTPEARYNERMSAVRESVEWSFGRLKLLWSFVGYKKKHRLRQSPIGPIFGVAALLTNCHTCMQPNGNQITMYFGLALPSIDEYLGIQYM